MLLWSRKPPPVIHDRSRLVGLDFTSSRVRGVSIGPGKTRLLHLDGNAEDLQLVVHLDRRPPEIGRAGVAILRRLPHATLSGFLPRLGQPKERRQPLSVEAALGLAFDKMRGPITADSEAAAAALPAYLTPPQVAKFVAAAEKAKFPLKGTVVAPLALVAHRATALLGAAEFRPEADDEDDRDRPEWVVPMRGSEAGPGAVCVVDVDDSALTASVVTVEPGEVRLLGSATWPKLAGKLWMERLLDAIADRCVRVCRRDPRDSAEAEQHLFDQLPEALERAARGHAVTLTVRSTHWYQDLPHHPGDLSDYCASLAKTAADGVRDLVGAFGLPMPPRAVWMTAAAARLPGLATAIYKNSAERTAVDALPENAIAEAAAGLVGRWQSGELPKAHLDTAVSVPVSVAVSVSEDHHNPRRSATPRG
jgi:hypothetical protein